MSKLINEQFGIEITENFANPQDLAAVAKAKLEEHGVVVFRKVQLSLGEYLSFGRHMGRIRPFVDENYRHPECPEVFVVSNKKTSDSQMGMDRVGYYWHSDSSFLPDPLPITTLYAQLAPTVGGETAFRDMRQAYAALPNQLKKLLRNKHSVHEGKWKYITTAKDIGFSLEELLARDERELPAPTHPIVLRHPKNGESCLYLTEGISRGIVEISGIDGERIIEQLWKHIFSHCIEYKHVWQPGDLVLWDNRRMIHRAFPSGDGSPRMLFRLGIEDGPFFLPEMRAS